MDWIHEFELFLFDFDGLLVNTEHLHYLAYVQMLKERGCRLSWSLSRFCEFAHLDSEALKRQIYREFPQLDPNWSVLYAEKKRHYYELIASGKVELMPGVSKLLRALEKETIRRCVVTNSLLEQIALIRSQIPELQTIAHWITREDYEKPKPDPEGYLRAIELYAQPDDRIIGFEDSVRGLQALKQTPALAILVCSGSHPLLPMALESKPLHFESIEDLHKEKSLGRGCCASAPPIFRK